MSTFKFRCVFCRQKIEAEESWIGMFADWTLRGIIFTGRFLSGKWLQKKVI